MMMKNRFEYLGKPMPVEFGEVCKSPMFQDKIRGRSDRTPFMFHLVFDKFLNERFDGDLPTNLYDLSKSLGYDDSISDMFSLDEDEYRSEHPNEYADVFENRTDDEKMNVFERTDFGSRSVFEFLQDVTAGNVFEDLLVHYGSGRLKTNGSSSGRSGRQINSDCDLIYVSESGEDIPVEVKTRWSVNWNGNEKIYVRHSSRRIVESGGLILVIYPNLTEGVRCAIVDPSRARHVSNEILSSMNKNFECIPVESYDLIDFNFWNGYDMDEMFSLIEGLLANR